jgi:hypothetical protein
MTASGQNRINKAFYHEMRNCSYYARIGLNQNIWAIYISQNCILFLKEERIFRRCKTPFFVGVPAQKIFRRGSITFILPKNIPTCMKKEFVLGLIGGFLGLATAAFVILSASTNEMILSGVQAALFSSLGLMGAAIAKKETRFAGYMLICSAVFITLTVPIANTLSLLYLYLPTVLCLGVAGTLCFMGPVEDPADTL